MFLLNGAEGGVGLGFVLVYVLMLVGVFYFIAWRPQKKEKKAMEEMLSTVAVGDTVLTNSGFYGVIIDMTDDMVILEFGGDRHCRIPMDKKAIARVEKPDQA
ncbi:MAG: preprotein translocase subunit YajC [bacterium]|nr:preprotein translocase subunit YajC [bacterium]